MITNAHWSMRRQSNSARATAIKALILDDSWWDRFVYLLKFTKLILSMIQYTDIDRPFLSKVHDVIDSAIEDIRNIINEREEDLDEKFFRWTKMTSSLHLLAFALSPRFYSHSVLRESITRVAPYKDLKVSKRYKEALQRLFPKHLRPVVRSEFMSSVSTDDCGLEALEDKNNVDAHNM